MKVRMTFEFGDLERRALAQTYGERGLATRETIRSWIEGLVTAAVDDIAFDAEQGK